MDASVVQPSHARRRLRIPLSPKWPALIEGLVDHSKSEDACSVDTELMSWKNGLIFVGEILTRCLDPRPKDFVMLAMHWSRLPAGPAGRPAGITGDSSGRSGHLTCSSTRTIPLLSNRLARLIRKYQNAQRQCVHGRVLAMVEVVTEPMVGGFELDDQLSGEIVWQKPGDRFADLRHRQ